MAPLPYYPTGSNIVTPPNGFVQVDSGPQVAQFRLASGTVTVTGTTAVLVSQPAVTASSVVLFTLKTAGGTVGAAPTLNAPATAGASFGVVASAGDTSTYNYLVIG